MKTQIVIPHSWLESLLRYANRAEEAMASEDLKAQLKLSPLLGFIDSAKFILRYEKR